MYKIEDIVIHRFGGAVIDSNTYLLVFGKDKIVIDPNDNTDLYEYIAHNERVYVLLTHEHFDHIYGLNELRKYCTCTVICSDDCSKNIQSDISNFSKTAQVLLDFHYKLYPNEQKMDYKVEPFICSAADVTFENSYSFELEGHTFSFIKSPGHSKGSVLIILDDKYLFSGDSLLPIPVITRFPGGSTKDYWSHTVPLLECFKEKISTVFPGHGEPGSMDDMMKLNKRPEKMRQ